MENASKALIMAGAILIALIIISLGVYMFSTMSNRVRSNSDYDEQAISAFNSEITPYLGSKIAGAQVNALIQKVISINNLAIRDGDTGKSIKITYRNGGKNEILEVKGNSLSRGLIRVDSVKYYEVKEAYNDYGFISELTIRNN